MDVFGEHFSAYHSILLAPAEPPPGAEQREKPSFCSFTHDEAMVKDISLGASANSFVTGGRQN